MRSRRDHPLPSRPWTRRSRRPSEAEAAAEAGSPAFGALDRAARCSPRSRSRGASSRSTGSGSRTTRRGSTFGAAVKTFEIESDAARPHASRPKVVVPRGRRRPRAAAARLPPRPRRGRAQLPDRADVRGARATSRGRAPVVAFPFGGDSSYWHDRESGAWAPYVLGEVIPQLVERYDVDPDRIAIGGISMGGFGAFNIARLDPRAVLRGRRPLAGDLGDGRRRRPTARSTTPTTSSATT